MNLTAEDITEINKKCYDHFQDDNQGVYLQPNGIPTSIKGHVVYLSWCTGGMKGGGYHEDSYLRPYTTGTTEPDFFALTLVLKKLKPELSFIEYKEIEATLIHDADYDGYEDYYGNRDDYSVRYVVVEDLIKHLSK